MKAITLASLTALAMAGVACSQAPEDVAQADPAPVVETVSAPEDDGFNLSILTDEGDATASDDGFNLSLPGLDDAPAETGLDLMDALPGGVEIEELPTVAPLQQPTLSVPEIKTDPVDDEPVIRIE